MILIHSYMALTIIISKRFLEIIYVKCFNY
jgi:hypothetical protein